MITINNKSRYFSASEDMFPTMERNFAWLFGMQTPEQGWKTVLAITIMYRAQGSAEEERQYGFPVGDNGEPLLYEDDFLADLMQAYLDKELSQKAPTPHSFEERQAVMKRLLPLKHTEEFYRRRCDNVFNENPDEFTLDDYIRSIRRQAREELITRFGQRAGLLLPDRVPQDQPHRCGAVQPRGRAAGRSCRERHHGGGPQPLQPLVLLLPDRLPRPGLGLNKPLFLKGETTMEFQDLLYRDLLISDSMEKNTLKEFPSEERKTLMQLLFPLKDKERFFYLYQDMTPEQYTAKVVTKARDLLDSDIFPYGSEIWLRLEDLAEIDNISAEAAELYGAWKDAEARHNAHKDEEGWF